MEVRSLKYFIAVYEEESISAASKRCFVAQPSISTSIAQLESQLEVKLFHRHRKGVTPSRQAHAFYKSARQLVGEFEALKGLFKQGEEPLPLTLAIMPTIDSGRIEALFGRIVGISERLQLRLVDLNEQADARIVSEQLRKKGERFRHLWDERYVLAMPHGHPLTLKSSVSLQDLHGVKFIERCLCEFHDEVIGYLTRHDIMPVTVAKAVNEGWTVALVAAGVGVAAVPESSTRGNERIVTRPIKGMKLSRRVGFAYDPTAPQPAALQQVLEQFKDSELF